MRLETLVNCIDYIELVNFDENAGDINGISYNSKTTEKNDIFVCLTGEHVDGHEYAEEAVANGATVIVAEKRLNIDTPQIIVEDTSKSIAQIASEFYANPSKKINVIGVTGTNGKTTVTHLIQSLYESMSVKCAIVGTLGYKFDSREKYHITGHTTPQAPDIQRLMYYMHERGFDNVTMEVSSHSLVQHRIDNIEFNGAVLTNLTQDHLDFHITMENYFKAKAKLFENIYDGDFAVINADDSYADKFMEVISSNVNIYTYGINKQADVMAKNISFDNTGAKFECIIKGKSYNVKLFMNGLFSVYNVLAALTAALAVGFDIEKSISILESIKGVAGRFEVITQNPMVIVDYAHTPDGLENVLKTAREITPKDGNLICIFGCGGDRDATKRPTMGSIAERLADKVIVTSDNPRSENPQQIITDILAGFKSISNVTVEPDRENAIKIAYETADVNDVIVIAGKGHEDYQILSTGTIHFDDREKVREIFVGK